MSASSSQSREQRLREAIRIKQAQNRAQSTAIPIRAPETPTPLDDLQRGMWLAHSLEPDSAAYTLAGACRVAGVLDEDALEAAFQSLVTRHRLLRSTFQVVNGEVEQCIQDTMAVRLERIEVATGQLINDATALAQRPFRLTEAPLVRLLLLEADDGDRLLMLMLHHLLADERSLADLWQALSELMNGSAQSTQSEPSAEEPQYDDWVAWQQAEAERNPAQAERMLDFWRQRLDPPPVDLDLPYLAPQEAPGPKGRLLVQRLEDQPAADLRRWAAAAGTTPFAVGALACRLLLQRLAKAPDFMLGTPVSVRHHPSMRSMLGAFINTVLLTDVADEKASVQAALKTFDEGLRAAMAHGTTPIAVLAEALAPERAGRQHALFRAMYVHQEHHALPPLGEATLEPVLLDLGVAKFDLTLFLAERENAMDVAIEYRRDRFRPEDMARLLDSFRALLAWLPAHPEASFDAFELISEADRAWLAQVSQGAASAPDDGSQVCALLPDQIAQIAQAHPAAPAIRAQDGVLDYATLQVRSNQFGAALTGAGVEAGDRVGVFLPRCADLVPALLGIQGLGAAYVPLDPTYPTARNQNVLEDADVRAVLTTSGLAGELPQGGWDTVQIDALVSAAGTTQGASAADRRAEPGDLAYLLYTSGSTGQPKGVMVSQENLRASTAARLQYYGDASSRFLLLPSVAFDSSVAGIYGTLAAGGALIIPSDDGVQDPRELVALIHAERVTHLLCVPSLYGNLLEADPAVAATLSVVIVAGERCPPALVARHFLHGPETRLFNEYGPTEATVWASVHEIRPGQGDEDIPIGRPISGVRVDVRDRGGRLLPPGIPGIGWISGPTVAGGYWNQPDRSAQTFVRSLPGVASAGASYCTGDLLSWDRQGQLHFHGRDDEQIKLRGFRIEPGEVESALAGLPGVQLAAVVVRTLGTRADAPLHLVAFVEGEMAEAFDWREALTARLPGHMIPTRLEPLDRLPRLPNGKIARKELMDRPLAAGPKTGTSAELTPCEAELRTLWIDILGCDDARPGDHFFNLGGTSLLAVRLALAIEKQRGVVLPPSEIFAHPELTALSARVDSIASAEDDGAGRIDFAHLFPIETSGDGDPLIFAIPHFFADLVAERFRGERPVWGLRGIGHRVEGNLGRWPTMEALGADLVRELQLQLPRRPLILAGYSFGASMAHEMAVQLEQSGIPVRQLVLIAPMPLDMARIGPLKLQIDALTEPVESLSSGAALRRWLKSNHPLAPDLYRRLWRRTAIEAWRRFQCQQGRSRARRGLPLSEAMQWADVRVDRFRLHANYQPRTTAVPTVIFNGIEPSTDAAETWRSRYTGPLDVVPVPDPHGDQDAVQEARRRILETLNEVLKH